MTKESEAQEAWIQKAKDAKKLFPGLSGSFKLGMTSGYAQGIVDFKASLRKSIEEETNGDGSLKQFSTNDILDLLDNCKPL